MYGARWRSFIFKPPFKIIHQLSEKKLFFFKNLKSAER